MVAAITRVGAQQHEQQHEPLLPCHLQWQWQEELQRYSQQWRQKQQHLRRQQRQKRQELRQQQHQKQQQQLVEREALPWSAGSVAAQARRLVLLAAAGVLAGAAAPLVNWQSARGKRKARNISP
jgi:hypothetical protein